MQKIELRQNLKELINKAKSESIIEFFSKDTKQPGGHSNNLLSLIVDSKSGFDQSVLDDKQCKILEQFNAKKYYETKFYSNIIKFISTNNFDTQSSYLQKSKHITEFYTYHNTLVTAYNLVENLLFQDSELRESLKSNDYKTAEDEGYLYFEILSDQNIEFQVYTLVISGINELVKNVVEFISAKQNIKFDETPKLILSDSGSNPVISIKLPKEISKSIAKIIDDAWQFLTNRARFKLEQTKKNFEESIDLIKQINNAEKEELISPQQAELWRRGIINSTEAIVMNNTLTKSKAEEMIVISNQKMLTEATKKYLTEGEK